MDTKLLTEALRSVLLAVREDLKPELQSAHAKNRADMVDMVLARLTAEVDTADVSKIKGSPISREDLHELRQSVEPDINKRRELQHRITEFAATEQTRRSTIEARLAELSKVSAGEEMPSDNKPLSKELLTDYLRSKLPEKGGIEVTDVTILPGGRSKGTILVDMKGANGSEAIVIRRDFAVNTTGVSVTYEYPIIKALWEAGVTVPQPLWLEEDTSVIGGAFIAFSKVPGKAMGTLFQSDAPPEFVKDFAATLAKIHAVDIDAAGLGNKLNWAGDHPVKAMVDDYYQDYLNDVPPTPLMDAAFAWLYLQMDKIGNHRQLVHGDAGLQNVMGEHGKVTGMMDWEFGHAGDPAEDVAYHRDIIEKILPWEDYLAAYREAGGQEISDIRIRFFTVWRCVLLGVMMGRARSMFIKGVNHDLRIATIGLNSFQRFMNTLAGHLAEFSKAE